MDWCCFSFVLLTPFNKDAHSSSATRMSDAFYGSLEEIFCGNVIVALCMTMSILVRLPAWSNQEYVNMASSTITQGRRRMCVCVYGATWSHWWALPICSWTLPYQSADRRLQGKQRVHVYVLAHANSQEYYRPCKSGYFLFLDMVPLWKKSFPSSTLQVLVDHVDTIVQQHTHSWIYIIYISHTIIFMSRTYHFTDLQCMGAWTWNMDTPNACGNLGTTIINKYALENTVWYHSPPDG